MRNYILPLLHIKVAVLPLTKKQSEKAEEVYATLAKHFSVEFDVAGQNW